MVKIIITQELVRELFDYKDGKLFWNAKVPGTIIGKQAGSLFKNKDGISRCRVMIQRKQYQLSRIIFLWHHGYLPEIVDHINRNSADDRIENLRAADSSGNAKNTCSRKNSSSRYLGVTKVKANGRWAAWIRVNKKTKNLGTFIFERDAASAYNKAAKIHHKEFANLNIV